MPKYTRDEVREARERLAELGLKPGSEVILKLEHVSRSGMVRWIDCYVVAKVYGRHTPVRITRQVAILTGYSYDTGHDGVKVEGCGMDMGFHLVYGLGRTLYREGFRCVGARCPSNDHSNGHRDADGTYLGRWERDGRTKHRGDGGYALNYRWL